MTACDSCGESTPALVVITGRGGESSVCKRCMYPPAALSARGVKQTAKPAPAASGQTSMPGAKP